MIFYLILQSIRYFGFFVRQLVIFLKAWQFFMIKKQNQFVRTGQVMDLYQNIFLWKIFNKLVYFERTSGVWIWKTWIKQMQRSGSISTPQTHYHYLFTLYIWNPSSFFSVCDDIMAQSRTAVTSYEINLKSPIRKNCGNWNFSII